jgi:hypothetical protein
MGKRSAFLYWKQRIPPIFDFISLINMVYTVVVKQPYLGFM